jgi:hypothetical protein
MEFILELLDTWCWFIAALPIIALVLIVAYAVAGANGPHPKINVFDNEKSFLDVQNG